MSRTTNGRLVVTISLVFRHCQSTVAGVTVRYGDPLVTG